MLFGIKLQCSFFLLLFFLFSCHSKNKIPAPEVISGRADTNDTIITYLPPVIDEDERASRNAVRTPYYYGHWWAIPDGYKRKGDEYSSFGKQFRSLEEISPVKASVRKIKLFFHDGATFPQGLEEFPNLKELEIFFYDSMAIPTSIGKLVGLEHLRIQGRLIGKLPKEIGELKKLNSLHLSVVVAELPEEIAQLNNLKSLIIHNHELQQLPEFLWKMTSLESLELYTGGIDHLPSGIGRLVNLKRLDVSDIYLKQLPPEIGNLKQLRYLDAQNNNLGSLPSEIGQLQSLDSINLRNNSIVTFPEEIGDLKKLTTIRAEDNLLINLPSGIGRLISLQNLDLENNLLKSLPDSICNLIELRYLNLHHNQIESLPDSIIRLKKLRIFYISKLKLITHSDAVWKFANKTGYTIPEVPEKINNHPLEFYLKHKDIDHWSKLYVQGKLALYCDTVSEFMASRIVNCTEETQPFYMHILLSCATNNPDDWDILTRRDDLHYFGDVFRQVILLNPCMFFRYVKHGQFKNWEEKWDDYVGEFVPVDERDSINNLVLSNLKHSCGRKYLKEAEEYLESNVFYPEK